MEYRNQSHVALVNFDYLPNERVRLYANTNFNHSSYAMTDVGLLADVLTTTPAGYNYSNVSDLGTISDLGVRRTLQIVGMEYRFANNMVTTNEFWWHDYKDQEPYLFDTEGRNKGFRVGLSYIF